MRATSETRKRARQAQTADAMKKAKAKRTIMPTAVGSRMLAR